MTVTDFTAMDSQLQVYEFLKVWWVKPDQDAHALLNETKMIELNLFLGFFEYLLILSFNKYTIKPYNSSSSIIPFSFKSVWAS